MVELHFFGIGIRKMSIFPSSKSVLSGALASLFVLASTALFAHAQEKKSYVITPILSEALAKKSKINAQTEYVYAVKDMQHVPVSSDEDPSFAAAATIPKGTKLRVVKYLQGEHRKYGYEPPAVFVTVPDWGDEGAHLQLMFYVHELSIRPDVSAKKPQSGFLISRSDANGNRLVTIGVLPKRSIKDAAESLAFVKRLG